MVLDAGVQRDSAARLAPAHDGADAVLVVVLRVLHELQVEGGPPGLRRLVGAVRLVIGGVLPQVVVSERLLGAGVEESVREVGSSLGIDKLFVYGLINR